jgi:hypothetical protein
MRRNKRSVDIRFLEMSYRKRAELAELIEKLCIPEKTPSAATCNPVCPQ